MKIPLNSAREKQFESKTEDEYENDKNQGIQDSYICKILYLVFIDGDHIELVIDEDSETLEKIKTQTEHVFTSKLYAHRIDSISEYKFTYLY